MGIKYSWSPLKLQGTNSRTAEQLAELQHQQHEQQQQQQRLSWHQQKKPTKRLLSVVSSSVIHHSALAQDIFTLRGMENELGTCPSC